MQEEVAERGQGYFEDADGHVKFKIGWFPERDVTSPNQAFRALSAVTIGVQLLPVCVCVGVGSGSSAHACPTPPEFGLLCKFPVSQMGEILPASKLGNLQILTGLNLRRICRIWRNQICEFPSPMLECQPTALNRAISGRYWFTTVSAWLVLWETQLSGLHPLPRPYKKSGKSKISKFLVFQIFSTKAGGGAGG